jgi:hypothetical protein
MKKNELTDEDKSLRPKKRRKKRFSPYKKGKYHLSKIEEYENYLNNIELLSKGGELDT